MQKTLLWTGAALGLLLAAGGCCPSAICSFKATPVNLCPNGQVRLEWNTGGDPVSIAPGVGTVQGSGDQTVRVAATTTFILSSTFRGRTETQNAAVTVSPSPSPPTLLGRVRGCDDRGRVLMTFQTDTWDPSILVGAVTNPHPEPMTVTHEGHTVEIPPGAQDTTILSGSRLVGDWVVEGPLRMIPSGCSDSTNPDPNAPPPALVGVDIMTRCS